MRLLLDESVPHRLKRSLPGHAVRTAVEMGWGGIRNSELLARAGKEFDALVTVDKNLQYQSAGDDLRVGILPGLQQGVRLDSPLGNIVVAIGQSYA